MHAISSLLIGFPMNVRNRNMQITLVHRADYKLERPKMHMPNKFNMAACVRIMLSRDQHMMRTSKSNKAAKNNAQ